MKNAQLLSAMSLAKKFILVTSKYLMLITLILVASIITPKFLSIQNLINLFRNFSFLGFISIGMTFVILMAGIDLSVGSTLAFCSVITALMQHWGIYLGYTSKLSHVFPTPLIFIIVLIVGGLIGLINGLIITKLNITDFVTTLGMMVLIRGFGFTISGGRTIFGVDKLTQYMGRGMIVGIPFVSIIWVISVIITSYVLKYTRFGFYLYASGENKEASRLSGLNPDIYRIIAYVISGFFAALGGICLAGRLNVGEPRVAQGWELDAIASVVIGGTSFSGGSGSVLKTVIGVVIIALIRNILNLLGVLPSPQQMIMGLVLLVAIIMQNFSISKKL